MKVNIRTAKWEDTQAICDLLKQMGYPQPLALIQEKFEILHSDLKAELLVAEEEDKVCGFFIPLFYSTNRLER
jgi:N-acetylglutamate synthase-like GNAT family acetyltransferase